jgi:acetyl/propionyl-CoA carboxylase alpha subunit
MPKIRRILIANRGEIAVRIQQTCHLLGIETVALYTRSDQNSLHVRLADRCVSVPGLEGFSNPGLILDICRDTQARAIHPGYGFLAERADFIRACDSSGVLFIGPPAEVVEKVVEKISVLEQARAAGFPTIQHSSLCYDETAYQELSAEASRIGYPVVIKSCRGGRGRGERLVLRPDQLRHAVQRAQAESKAVYGQRKVFLEKAILPAHQISVQILADSHGNRVHLGEREGSILLGNQKLIEESPSPTLTEIQRKQIHETALNLAELFKLQNAVSIEFLVDRDGAFYFTEIKARIQVDHPLTESRTRLDLVNEQIRLAQGDRLNLRQADVDLRGWAMLCRVSAEDPWTSYFPSPGVLRSVNLPVVPEVRLDTFIYQGCEISPEYDPLLAKLTAWGPDRPACLKRALNALGAFKIQGVPTNQPLLQNILADPEVAAGRYDTGLRVLSMVTRNGSQTIASPFEVEDQVTDEQLRDLAVAAAISYRKRGNAVTSILPERLNTGWHRQSRRLNG